MRRSILCAGAVTVAAALLFASQAWDFPEFSRQTKAACAGCHVNPAGGADLNATGKVFQADHAKAPEKAAAGAEYVGSNKCRMCHLKQFKSWQDTPHAKALEMLKAAPESTVATMAARLKVELKGPPAENDACVTCHVTGFHLSGGYPAADSAKNVALSNVTCESCHGPGSKHVGAPMAEKKKLINRAVTAKMCMQCHTSTMSPKFDFQEFKKRGVHAVAAVKTGN